MNLVKLDLDGLKQLREKLHEGRHMRVKVGVLSNKAHRPGGGPNNPTIGLVHEYGSKTSNIPARSFLRMPLMLQLPKKIAKIGRAVWRTIIQNDGMEIALTGLGIEGENTVQEAFTTRGFGTWAPNKPATIRRKGSDMPLIDQAFLRKSITSKVVKRPPK